VPADYFTAMLIAAGDEDAKLSSQNAIEIADKQQMMRASEMIDDFGLLRPML
jgi:hypothetical protein